MTTNAQLAIVSQPAHRWSARNPFVSLLCRNLASQGARILEFSPRRVLTAPFDIWHIHWPDGRLNRRLPAAWTNSALYLLLMDLARARGVRIVWTAHNAGSHEVRHPRLQRWFWPRFIARLDGWISLSEAGAQELRRHFPALSTVPQCAVIPHGHYRDIYPPAEPPETARAALGLDSRRPLILAFGQVRPYKGLVPLIEAFHRLPGPASLAVVGSPVHRETARAVELAAARGPGVILDLQEVSVERASLWFSAATLVALPYAAILNSGAALLALSMDRPVAVTNSPAIRELQQATGREWVRLLKPPLNPDELGLALDWALQSGRPEHCPLTAFDWPRLAAATMEFFRKVRAAPRIRTRPATAGRTP